jgi:RNA polymerase sigma-70 factor (ECF subfamily)
VIVRSVPESIRAPRLATTSDDSHEFEAEFRSVSRSAFLLARQLGRSSEESLDIVQEAALRGWRYRSTRAGAFRPWFLAIVYRLSCRRNPSWLPLPANWDRQAADTFTSSMDPELVAGLRKLPMRQRAALWLRYCDDLSVAEVARILRCSDAAAKQLLLRGREGLRARLTSRTKEEPR